MENTKFCMGIGDTNFIGVVNAEHYRSFVDEDWELGSLLKHFGTEMKAGHILVFQMTEEGIEHSWKVEIRKSGIPVDGAFYRRSEGYIEVTGGQLFLVDYDCLTMAAQFEDENIPDKNCSNYRIEIEDGKYRVEVVQYYDVDRDKYVGTNSNETDLVLNFIKVEEFEQDVEEVFWCTYC